MNGHQPAFLIMGKQAFTIVLFSFHKAYSLNGRIVCGNPC